MVVGMKGTPYVDDKVIGKVVNMLDGIGAVMATKYLAPNLVVRATRRGKFDKRNRSFEFVVTIGKPNYRERDFIAQCKRAGEKFPIKKIQLKYPPKSRK